VLQHFQDTRCPIERRPVGGALAPVAAVTSSHQELPIGCLWFTYALSGAWQGRKGDHVCEKRCSKLDLLACDLNSGYAALRFNTRESEVAYRSLLLRDDARATSPSSPVVCRIVGAPPLCAPARVIPGRTLLEGEGRVGSRASPQLQSKPSVRQWAPAGVPLPVPLAAYQRSDLHASPLPLLSSQGRVMPPLTFQTP
jgi:hypothetical protein